MFTIRDGLAVIDRKARYWSKSLSSQHCHDVWYGKTIEWCGYPTVKFFGNTFTHFDRIHERDRRTDIHRMYSIVRQNWPYQTHEAGIFMALSQLSLYFVNSTYSVRWWVQCAALHLYLSFKKWIHYATWENGDNRIEQVLQRQKGGQFDIRPGRPKVVLRRCATRSATQWHPAVYWLHRIDCNYRHCLWNRRRLGENQTFLVSPSNIYLAYQYNINNSSGKNVSHRKCSCWVYGIEQWLL